MREYFVYIMASPSRTLYIGITNDLEQRVWEHKMKFQPQSFTRRYNITLLVYAEAFTDPGEAIARDKQVKGWFRAKKLALIESVNPEWNDLSAPWYG